MGIPGECQMNCHRVKADASGKFSEAPSVLSETAMRGAWTVRAFSQSWDGKTIVSHTFDGFKVTTAGGTHEYKVQLLHRNIWWSPDNKKFLMWLPAGIALASVTELGPAGNAPKYTLIYKPPKDRFPYGVNWSPSGNDIFVSEHVEVDGKTTNTAIKKIPISGGGGTDILVHPVELTFYQPPETWYEDGSGPKTKKAYIAFGAKDGLYVMDDSGQNKTKLAAFSPEGVRDVIWDPSGKDQFLLFLTQACPVPGPGNKSVKGLYLVHPDKKGDDILEKINDSTDLHTVYFSRKGKYICWANGEGIFYRETAKQEKATPIVINDAPGAIKGFNWDNNEQKIAVAIENKLFIYDVATKAATLVVKVDEKTFIAEPHWKNDEIVYSTFTNIASPKKKPEDKDTKKETPKK